MIVAIAGKKILFAKIRHMIKKVKKTQVEESSTL